MVAPSSAHPSLSDVQRVDKTSLSPPTVSSTGPTVSMFSNSNNTHIKQGKFSITTNHNTYNGSSAAMPLDLLHKSAAPNAILNSGGRADEVRCHPGTREEVIGLVEKSIKAPDHSGPRMLWLSGPAGAGKSAIMQTVAERCEEQGVPHANFFFFRADSTRSDASALVATLMHQIIQLYPAVESAVAAVLASNPLLFRTSLQKQFSALLNQAFTTALDPPSSVPPIVLLIDGLDECDYENKTAQWQVLQALDTLLVQKGTYFRVVVASRVEPQIAMAFKKLHSQVDSIFLDEQYSPENDIRLFVTAEFDSIKSTHYLAHTLGPDWPSQSDVEGIVTKSSGQFIYAATVMRFITHSPASPVLSLLKIQGLVPLARNTPFAHLDAVYSHILAQVDDLEAVKAICAMHILDFGYVAVTSRLIRVYRPEFSDLVFNSCLSELTALVSIDDDILVFYHASFTDFLLDKTRAGAYHVDLEMFCTAAVPTWWVYREWLGGQQLYTLAIAAFDHIKHPTPHITAALKDPYLLVEGPSLFDYAEYLQQLASNLHRIYAPHDLQSFTKILDIWLSGAPDLARILPPDLLKLATRSGSSQVPPTHFQMFQTDHQTLPSDSVYQIPTSDSQIRSSDSDHQVRPSTSEVLPVDTQMVSAHKRGIMLIEKGLRHLTGKGKSGKK